MAEHGPTGPPWKRLTQEQLNGAQFALRYLRTSVTVKGEALANLDMLLSEIDEERKIKASDENIGCPRDQCPPGCEVWKRCGTYAASEPKQCPSPNACHCRRICGYRTEVQKNAA